MSGNLVLRSATLVREPGVTPVWVGPEAAAGLLAAGKAVVLPTETVWGLAANLESCEILFQLKDRDPSKALALAFPSREAILGSGLVRWDPRAEILAARFWPGPLTLILPAAREGLPARVLGQGGGMALRVPACPEALEVLRLFGQPIVLTSANRSGQEPPQGRFPDSLFQELPRLEARVWPASTASTVVSLLGQEPRILRQGALSEKNVLEALKPA